MKINTIKSEPNFAICTERQLGYCKTCAISSSCIAARVVENIEINPCHGRIRSLLINNLENLLFQGEKSPAIYIVKSGLFKSYVITPSGEEQVIEFHYPGDIIALEVLTGEQLDYSVMALQTSSVCVIPLSYMELAMTKILPEWMIQFLRAKIKKENTSHVLLSKKSAKTRIAAFLLEISNNYEALGYSKDDLSLNMSRQDIGNYLGLASETISRAFTWMRDKGLLELDRREVKIVDYENLVELAQNLDNRSNQ